MAQYPLSGMSAWFSQRIIYTINRLLEDREVPLYAGFTERWVYEGTIVPINHFLAYFQLKFRELNSYIKEYLSGELEDLFKDLTQKGKQSQDRDTGEPNRPVAILLNHLNSWIALHYKILTLFPKPQAHFDALVYSISAMKRKLDNWLEVVTRTAGTLESKEIPFQRLDQFLRRLNQFLQQAGIPGRVVVGEKTIERNEASEAALKNEFLRSGLYPFIYTHEVDFHAKLVLVSRAKDHSIMTLSSHKDPKYRGSITAEFNGQVRQLYPRSLVEEVHDRVFELMGEDPAKDPELADLLKGLQRCLDQALRDPRVSLLLDTCPE